MKVCTKCKDKKALSEFSKMGNRQRARCKTCCNELGRNYAICNSKTIARRFSLGKGSAKSRDLAWTLSLEEYSDKIQNAVCHYCDGPLSTTGHGLDRVNNFDGYTIVNTVPCCLICNRIKCEWLTYDDMKLIGERARLRGGWKYALSR